MGRVADEVVEHESLGVDQSLLLAMRRAADRSDPLGPGWIEEMARDFTALGGTGVLSLITLAVLGYLLLAGFTHTDNESVLQWMADKVLGLRIFPDSEDKLNLSLEDVDGALLVVSQFTLYGDTRKGRRPSFLDAATPDIAIPLYEQFVEMLRARGVRTETGEFGAMMQVALVNDGPVTLWLER